MKIAGAAHDSRHVPVRVEVDGLNASGAFSLELVGGTLLPVQPCGDGGFLFVLPEIRAGEVLQATVHARPAAGGGVEIKETAPHQVEVRVGGELLTAYHHDPAERKPFLYPVFGPGGRRMTRGYPMESIEGEPQDHPHHRSLWVSYGDVNGADCWSQGSGSGWQRPRALSLVSGPVFGALHAVNDWLDRNEEPVVHEERTYTFYATPADLRIVDASVTFRAAYGDVKFGDTKEGGILAVRVTPAIDGDKEGTLCNAEGKVGEKAVWGRPSPWVDNYGPINGLVCGLALLDHPSNLRHPTPWHARGYGLIGANCFGLSHFTHGEKNGDYLLASGQSLTFRYRIVLHAGATEQAAIGDRYLDFVEPPKVSM